MIYFYSINNDCIDKVKKKTRTKSDEGNIGLHHELDHIPDEGQHVLLVLAQRHLPGTF